MTQALHTILEARILMIEYLNLKVQEEDWHGVSDAANDLRELDVRRTYESVPILVDRQ